MSSEQFVPDQEQAGTAGNGVDGGGDSTAVNAGASETSSSDEQQAAAARDDFKSRAQSDPDFAWEQVRKAQSRADRMRGVLGGLTPELIEQAGGGDVILNAVNQYVKLQQDPTLGQYVQQLQRGETVTLPTATEDHSGDDYEDEETSGLKKLMLEIKSNMDTRFAALETRQGTSSVGERTRHFLGEWNLNDEERGNFNRSMQAKVSQLTQTEEGRKFLLGITQDQYDAIALPLIKEYIADIGERRHLQKLRDRQGAATDSPSALGTTGREGNANAKPVIRGRVDLEREALAALNDACRDAGLDPLRLGR